MNLILRPSFHAAREWRRLCGSGNAASVMMSHTTRIHMRINIYDIFRLMQSMRCLAREWSLSAAGGSFDVGHRL